MEQHKKCFKYLKHISLITFLFFLFLPPKTVFAGGDSWKVYIEDFDEKNNLIEFKIIDNPRPPVRDCKKFKVLTKYKRVPWYSWLPPVKTSHPTPEQHNEAIQFIKEVFQKQKVINFGYMGRGLIHSDEFGATFVSYIPCLFATKGLLLHSDSNTVLAFYNPV